MRKYRALYMALALSAGVPLLLAGPVATPVAAQGLTADGLGCADFPSAWTKARDVGDAGRRETLKSAMAALEGGDQELATCMAEDFVKHYLLLAASDDISNGFSTVINEVRGNLKAVQALPAAQQCDAATVFVNGWDGFQAERPDVPDLVHRAMSREQAKLCANP